jgi:hypothetical protein
VKDHTGVSPNATTPVVKAKIYSLHGWPNKPGPG